MKITNALLMATLQRQRHKAKHIFNINDSQMSNFQIEAKKNYVISLKINYHEPDREINSSKFNMAYMHI